MLEFDVDAANTSSFRHVASKPGNDKLQLNKAIMFCQ